MTKIHIGQRMVKTSIAVFLCMVYFAIVLIHSESENLFIYVFRRMIETIIGIVLSLRVNYLPFFKKIRQFKEKYLQDSNIAE